MKLTFEEHKPTSNHPSDILRHYLGDIIHGANDGIISTFAVVSGVEGARAEPIIVIILCFINLIADGISVGASRFLSIRTVAEANGHERGYLEPLYHALVSALSFFSFGLCPLLTFIFPYQLDSRFLTSAIITAITLFCVGSLGVIISSKHWFRNGIEMLIIGSVVSIIAYSVGFVIAEIID